MPLDLELRVIDPPVRNVQKILPCIERERRKGSSKKHIRRCVERYADYIYRCINAPGACTEHRHTLKLSLRGLEISGLDYAEKLVLRLDYSYILYSLGVKVALAGRRLAQKLPSKNHIEIQPHKHFSGDVSGSLGEAVFTYIAINHYGIQNLAHLRPRKNTYPAPDFIVEGRSDALKLEPLITPSGQLPGSIERVFVECKAVAGNPLGKDRIMDSLIQLSGLLDHNSAGLIFILHKPNFPEPPYIAHSVGVCFTNC